MIILLQYPDLPADTGFDISWEHRLCASYTSVTLGDNRTGDRVQGTGRNVGKVGRGRAAVWGLPLPPLTGYRLAVAPKSSPVLVTY